MPQAEGAPATPRDTADGLADAIDLADRLAAPPRPSLRLRRTGARGTPLIRVTWPGQPVLGSLDFDDTEAA